MRSLRPARLLSAKRVIELLSYGRGRDVLVEAEEVVRVVARLDRARAGPRSFRVGRADARLALVAEEVDVRAGVALLQRRGEVASPRPARTARSSAPS